MTLGFQLTISSDVAVEVLTVGDTASRAFGHVNLTQTCPEGFGYEQLMVFPENTPQGIS